MGARSVIEAESPKGALRGRFGKIDRSQAGQAVHIANLENTIGELENAGLHDIAVFIEYLKRCVEDPTLWIKSQGTFTEREFVQVLPRKMRDNGMDIQAENVEDATRWLSKTVLDWRAKNIPEAESPKGVFRQLVQGRAPEAEKGRTVSGRTIRDMASRYMVNGVYIWFQPKRFPEAEGVLQINFFRYGLVRQDWASFGTLAGALRRWRTLEGAKLWINGKETGTVGPRNPQLTQIDRDTWRPGAVHVGGGGVVEAEGPREFFKSQLQAPAQLMRAAGLHVVEAPYKGEKGVTYSLRGTLYQLDWSWLVGYAERGNLSADLEIWFSQKVIESSVGEVAAIRNRLREACYWIKYITDNVKLRDTAHAIITSNLDKLESIQEIQEAEGPKEFFNHIHSWARILQGGGYTRKGANFVYRHEFPKFIVDSEVMPLPGGVVLFNVAIENKADELDFAVYAFSLGDAEMTKVAQEIPPIFAGWKAAAEHLEPRTASHAVNAKLTELFGKDRAEGSGDGSLAEAESPKRALKAAGSSAHAVRDTLRRAGFKLEERTLRYERWIRQGHAHEPDTYWLAVRFVAYGEGEEQRWDLVKYSKRGNNALWSMEQTTTDSMLFRLKRLFFHPHTGEPFTND